MELWNSDTNLELLSNSELMDIKNELEVIFPDKQKTIASLAEEMDRIIEYYRNIYNILQKRGALDNE